MHFNKQVAAASHISAKSTAKFARKWVQKFLTSQWTVTLSEDQGHSNRYQNVELSGLLHPTKFKRNRFVNGQAQANVLRVYFCDKTT